jgi:Protein of unknown function (DUF2631)
VPNTEVERHTGVDVEDVPSAEWGWSEKNHGLIQLGGVLAGLFLLAMVHWAPGWGNHDGKVEEFFLVGFALAIFIIVGRDWFLRRRGWIR